jgi:hypothetical protein
MSNEWIELIERGSDTFLAVLAGTLLGAWLSFRFGKFLQTHQLHFEEKLQSQQLSFTKRLQSDQLDFEQKLLDQRIEAHEKLHAQLMEQCKAITATLGGFIAMFNQQMNELKGYFEEMRNSMKASEQQTALAALTTYSDIIRALWEHNESRAAEAQRNPKLDGPFWVKNAKDRYGQLITTLDKLREILGHAGYQL